MIVKSEIKLGSIVDVCGSNDNNSTATMDSSLGFRVETGVRLSSINPWWVVAIGELLPLEDWWGEGGYTNSTILVNVANNSIIAYAKVKFLTLHVDQEKIMENKRNSLEKWGDTVDQIGSLVDTLGKFCGYCNNVTVAGDIFPSCNICPLHIKGLCSTAPGADTPLRRVIDALRGAGKDAEILRDGIRDDIAKTLDGVLPGGDES